MNLMSNSAPTSAAHMDTPLKAPIRTITPSTCCYCGVGCGVLVEAENLPDGSSRIIGVQGDPNHPANFGRLCTKGSTLHLTAAPQLYNQVRAATPEIRLSRQAHRAPANWDAALDLVAKRFADIVQEHGPDAVGIYISGQLLTEDYYVFNKLAKGLLGTNNVDTNSRLCMSSAVAGYKQTLGADAPPCSYEDFDHADTLFIVGSNMAFAHPILFRRIEDARARNPAMKMVVVDPRKTDTAQGADLHLSIQPGTDVALFHGMLHIMLWEGWVDEAYITAHTEGFAELKQLVRDYTPKAVAQICGIPEAQLQQATRLFATSRATLSLYCQGLNQSSSGTSKNAALINLHLATAQIGKPGAGPFSLTGQPNAMGGREVGGLANLLSAHRDMANPVHRAEIAQLWGVSDVPAKPGLTAVEMFTALREKKLKAVWIACTNPAQSLPDQMAVREALQHAEFVVLQDAYAHTATAKYADVLLPATTWGERDGTVTNSERRISRVRASVPPFAESRDDWRIVVDIAHRLEAQLRPGAPTLFPYTQVEQIWNEHRESTRGRDLDITGLSYAMLESDGPQQWPLPEGAITGKARLYEDGIYPTASGRAKFVSIPYHAVAEPVDARYPYALNTGRLRDQWHSGSRTGTVARLYSHAPEPCIQLSPRDMERLSLSDGDYLHVTSKRASMVLPAQTSADMAPGQTFIAMHWGEEFVSGSAGRVGQVDAHSPHGWALGVNALTCPAFDPYSKQPELKHAPVKLLKAELPWRLAAFGWFPQDQALSLQLILRPLLAHFAYGSCVLFGREADPRPTPTVDTANDATESHPPQMIGVLLRLAHYESCDSVMQAFIEQRFGVQQKSEALQASRSHTGPHILRYADKRRHALRALRVEDNKLQAALLAGNTADVAAENWLRAYLEDGESIAALGRLLLSPGSQAPIATPTRGKIICNCFNVGAAAIDARLSACDAQWSAEACLADLQAKLQCGTNCGSCVPELKRMITDKRTQQSPVN